MWLRARNTSRHGGIGDEVDVALPVAQLDVGEPVPLLGERAVRLGERGGGVRDATESSPRLLAVSVPSASTMSPTSTSRQPLVVAAQRGLDREQLDLARAVAERRNERPPVERSAMTRPHTCTCLPAARRCSHRASSYLPAASCAPPAAARTSAMSRVAPRRGCHVVGEGVLCAAARVISRGLDDRRCLEDGVGSGVVAASSLMARGASASSRDAALLERAPGRREQVRLDEAVERRRRAPRPRSRSGSAVRRSFTSR